MNTKPMEGRNVAYARSGAAAGGGENFVRTVASTTAIVTLIVVGLLIAWLAPSMLNRSREAQWRDAFADAERARDSGDRYRALEMYIRSARMASSTDDWRAQLTIACGLQKLGKTEGPSLYGFNVIVSAMDSAERQKSAEGMKAAADAFASLGASYADFALSRIREDWSSDPSGDSPVLKRRTFDEAGVQAPGC